MPFPRWTKTGLCPVIASLVYLLASRVVGAAAADGNAPDALPRHAIARLGNLNFQHGAKIRAVAWSPNGRLIASAGASVGRPTIRIWDASAGSELSAIDGPKSDCHSLSFSRDARLLALASGDGTTHVYEVLTGREVRQVPHVADVGPRERIGEDGLKVLVLSPRAVLCHAAFSPGGSLLASAHGDGVLLCEPVTGKQVRKLPGAAAVAWSPDGKMLATARAGRDAPITLYDSNTGGEIRQLKREGNGFSSVAFSSDGNCVVGAALGREALRGWAYVWNVHSGQELRSFQPDKGSFACVACSPTKGIVALVHPDNSIVLYDLEDGRELRKLQGHGGWVRGVAFSPDGRTLASVGWDRFVHLWDVQTGKERIGDCPGHRGPVSSVTFTGDGKRIVTGGEDGTVRLWDPTGKQVKVLSGHEKTVSAVALSPGGRFIASCSQDGNVCLWEAPWDSQAPAL